VDFKLPYDEVVAMWRRTFSAAFAPEAIYRRFLYNQENTYPHRIEIPPTGKLSVSNVWRGLSTLAKLVVKVGLLSDYRRVFWRMAKPAFKSGDIETVIHVSLVSHHMISYAREAAHGQQSAAFYHSA